MECLLDTLSPQKEHKFPFDCRIPENGRGKKGDQREKDEHNFWQDPYCQIRLDKLVERAYQPLLSAHYEKSTSLALQSLSQKIERQRGLETVACQAITTLAVTVAATWARLSKGGKYRISGR